MIPDPFSHSGTVCSFGDTSDRSSGKLGHFPTHSLCIAILFIIVAFLLGKADASTYDPFAPVYAPSWTTDGSVPFGILDSRGRTILNLNTSGTLKGGSMSSPARYILRSIGLGGISDTVTFSLGVTGPGSAPDPTKKYIELYVSADIAAFAGSISVANGVNVTIWIGGNLNLSGNVLVNNNALASTLTIYGINPPSGTSQSFDLGNGTSFFGRVYAPAAEVILGGGNICGTIVCKAASFNGNTHLYYDEASTVPKDYISAFGALNLNNVNLWLGGSGFSSFYQVSGSTSSTGLITVDNGAALECPSTWADGLTVYSGSKLALGNLNLTNYVALNGTATLDFDLSTTPSANVAYGNEFSPSPGSVTLNVNSVAGFGSGTYNLFTAGTSLDANSFVLGNVPGGLNCALAVSGSSVGLVLTFPPMVTSGTTAAATCGIAFSYRIAGTNNPTSFSAVGLPAGLSLDTFTGLISGTPTATGTSNVLVSAINAGGSGASTLTIVAQTALDFWKSQNFTAAELTNPDISGGTADPNHNGIPNLLEYAFNGDPKGHATSANILPQVSVNNSSNSLQLALTRYLDRNDITLTVQAADDLTGSWADLAGSLNGAAFSIITPGISVLETGTGNSRAVTITDLYPVADPAHPKRFMRVKVSQ